MRLAFLHIPRTGGTSLWFVLRHQFDWRRTLYFRDGESADQFLLDPRCTRQIDDIELVGGHINRIYDVLEENGFRHIVMLRHPVERLISTLNYSIAYHHASVAPQLERGWTLLDFARSNDPEWWAYRSNIFVRALSGLGVTSTAPVTAEHLEMAKTALAERCFFGFTQRHQAFLDGVSRLIDRPLGGSPRINGSTAPSRNSDLPPPVFEALEHENRFDVELYEWALALDSERERAKNSTGKASVAAAQRAEGAELDAAPDDADAEPDADFEFDTSERSAAAREKCDAVLDEYRTQAKYLADLLEEERMLQLEIERRATAAHALRSRAEALAGALNAYRSNIPVVDHRLRMIETFMQGIETEMKMMRFLE